jgi:hypothetical protein
MQVVSLACTLPAFSEHIHQVLLDTNIPRRTFMKKQKNLTRMLGIAMLAAIFGAGSAYAQSAKGDAASKDAAGKTSENRAGKMSPTGQNETTSVKPEAGTSSSTSGASGAADSTTKNAAGKTSENRAGRMSATGENETTSAKAKARKSAKHFGSGASGTSGASSGADVMSKDASGKTSQNKAGRMSPTGQNETTSAAAGSETKK